MKRYLLDTNICIYYIKGMYDLGRKFQRASQEACFISELTVAEMKYGIANSKSPHLIKPVVDAFISKFVVVPIYDALTIYAVEKTRL